MKRWLAALMLLSLTACSNEDSEELTIQPKELETEELAIVEATAMDFMEFYYLNGEFPEGYNMQLELEYYQFGEKIEPSSSMSSFPTDSFNNGLVAFGKSASLEGYSSFVISTPSGKVMNSYEIDEEGGRLSTWGGLLENQQVLEKERPIYAAYYATKTGQSMGSAVFVDENGKLDLPSIEELDHFYALAITLVEEE